MPKQMPNAGPIAVGEVAAIATEPSLTRQVLATGEGTMLVRHIMSGGWEGARHSHPHEQLVYVVRVD